MLWAYPTQEDNQAPFLSCVRFELSEMTDVSDLSSFISIYFSNRLHALILLNLFIYFFNLEHQKCEFALEVAKRGSVRAAACTFSELQKRGESLRLMCVFAFLGSA